MPQEAVCSSQRTWDYVKNVSYHQAPGGTQQHGDYLYCTEEGIGQLVYSCVTPLHGPSPVGLSDFVCTVFWTL